MTKKSRSLVVTAMLVLCGQAQGQTALIPIWEHVDPFGAGSFYPESDQMRTRIAFDPSTGRLHRSVMEAGNVHVFTVQTFDTDGVDLTPPQPPFFASIQTNSDGRAHDLRRLFAVDSTLGAIVHYDVMFDDIKDVNWLKLLDEEGESALLIGSGSTAMYDMWHDTSGTLVLVDGELSRYSMTNWPNGSISIDGAQRMSMLGNSIVLGVPPSITRINRTTMTPLWPIAVPSSGSAVAGVCLTNGNTAFNYAAVNTNNTIDLGLADIVSGSVWNTSIAIPPGAQPTAYHVDEEGNFWIAFSKASAGINDDGLLYGFSPSGYPFNTGSYGRGIDDITSSGSRLFLTGRQSGNFTGTYLAAFDTDLTTGISPISAAAVTVFPNPANETINVRGIPAGVRSLRVIDATGRPVKELATSFGATLSFSTADLAPGSYFIRITGSEGSNTLPFQVVR